MREPRFPVTRGLVPALVLLAGCSFVPPLDKPAAPVPAAWPAPAAGARPVEGLAWQALLPDPRLQALVNAALGNNRDLRIAVARVAEARALYGVARADRLPTINATAGLSAARLPADLSGTGQPLVARRHDVAIGLTGFELDFWGRVKSLDQAALASYLATGEAQAAFRLSLVADVASAYFVLQESEARAALAQETMANRAQYRDLVRARRDVGLAGDLDYFAAEGAWQSARADLESLERARAAAANSLALLVGTAPEGLPPARRLTERDVVADLAAPVPSTALLRRPDVRAAEQRLVAANANIGAARAAFLPRVAIGLSAGTASRTVSGLFDAGSRAWSFVPSLAQPLFDAGRNEAALDLAQARKVIAVADYERTIQQAFREVADLLAARDTLARQLSAQEAAERAQAERERIADARYRAGASSYLEVLDAQREANAARQATIQVRRALLVSAAQLYKALGGGGDAAGS